jgi:hypothetical protein
MRVLSLLCGQCSVGGMSYYAVCLWRVFINTQHFRAFVLGKRRIGNKTKTIPIKDGKRTCTDRRYRRSLDLLTHVKFKSQMSQRPCHELQPLPGFTKIPHILLLTCTPVQSFAVGYSRTGRATTMKLDILSVL